MGLLKMQDLIITEHNVRPKVQRNWNSEHL